MFFVRFFVLIVTVGVLSGCSRVELASHAVKKVVNSGDYEPEYTKSKGYYKVGSPYTIKGKRYYPAVNYGYDKTGIASWYGPNFHGKTTANGEKFDQNEMTAAHKTLPLPSIVRVTNLENGKSLIVRVNDRGPYAHGRIIDMSKRSAELLGFKHKGVAKVRVEVLEAESRMVAKVARDGGSTRGMEVAMNKPSYRPPEVIQVSESSVSKPNVVLDAPQTSASIPGHMKDGAFYPDPMISEYPVEPHSIFVQAGAFSSREAAMKASSALDGYGRAQVYPALVKGQQFYRIRFPADSVETADNLVQKLVEGGHNNAIIVVD